MKKKLDDLNKDELKRRYRKLKERYDHVLKLASIEIFTLDHEGNMTSSTPSIFEFLKNPDETNGETINVFNLKPIINSELYDILQETLKNGKKMEAGPIYTTSEGKELFINIKTLPNQNIKNKITGLTAIIENVTESAKLQQEIKKLADMTDTSEDAIIRLGIFGRIESWNKGAKHIFGYKEDEIVGHMFEEIVPKDCREDIEGLMKGVLKKGFIRNFETYSMHKNGKQIPINLTATSLKDSHNNVVGVSVVMKDLTEMKKYEQQIINYSNQLEESNKLKDLFTDIMRHDLFNPLNVIEMMSQILEEYDFKNITPENEEELKEMTKILTRNAKKMEEMINNAAQLEEIAKAGDIEYEELDLTHIIQSAVEGFETLAAQKNMKIINNVKNTHKAQVSPVIEDVFINFISNAIKYAPENTEITIDIQDASNSWKITVKDQGEGVPDAYKENIFHRFERIKKEGVKGAGLGLAIVKRIIEQHKGNAWVEDNPPGGSIFCVKIPKRQELIFKTRTIA